MHKKNKKKKIRHITTDLNVILMILIKNRLELNIKIFDRAPTKEL